MSDFRLDRLEDQLGRLLATRAGKADFYVLSRRWKADPVGFIEGPLGATLTAAQREIAELVRDHPRVAVRSANGIGKDFLAARLAVWAAATGWLVLVTGPTDRQVRQVVMGEAFRAWTRGKLGGEFFETAWRIDRGGRAGILAFTSNDVSRLTGLHAPKVMAIITEAQGVESMVWEGIQACLTGSESRLLAVGNPLVTSGRFFEACRSPNWRSVKLSAFDHPNIVEGREVIPGAVTQAFVDTIAVEYGTGSGVYAARVLGEFPDDTLDGLVRRSWLDRAFALHESRALEDKAQGERITASVDPARFGPDTTAVVVRQGQVVRAIVTWAKLDTMETADRVVGELRAHGIAPKRAVRIEPTYYTPTGRVWRSDGRVVVDGIGIGAGVLDRLRQLHYDVVEHNGGRQAIRADRFGNLRAEGFWALRKALEEGRLALPRHERLADELAAIRWRVLPTGRIQIEEKDAIRERLGRSPDIADALAMSFVEEARRVKDLPPVHW